MDSDLITDSELRVMIPGPRNTTKLRLIEDSLDSRRVLIEHCRHQAHVRQRWQVRHSIDLDCPFHASRCQSTTPPEGMRFRQLES